jgi:hypothetical protein
MRVGVEMMPSGAAAVFSLSSVDVFGTLTNRLIPREPAAIPEYPVTPAIRRSWMRWSTRLRRPAGR